MMLNINLPIFLSLSHSLQGVENCEDLDTQIQLCEKKKMIQHSLLNLTSWMNLNVERMIQFMRLLSPLYTWRHFPDAWLRQRWVRCLTHHVNRITGEYTNCFISPISGGDNTIKMTRYMQWGWRLQMTIASGYLTYHQVYWILDKWGLLILT